jgi:GntR family transcriptional regulator
MTHGLGIAILTAIVIRGLTSDVWQMRYMASGLRRIKTTNASLHHQAQLYLRDLIENGTYVPGQKFPSEGVFAEQLGISRPTLREALHNLQAEGMIVRKHGVGTFVSPSRANRLESGLEVLESIEHIASRRGIKTEMGKVEIEERPPKQNEISGLECDPADHVLSVARTILIDKKPVAYLWDVILTKYLSRDELGEMFHGSVLDIFLKRGQPMLTYSFTGLAAVAVDRNLARHLEIPPKTPLLKLEARLFTQENTVVDYSISYFVPDYFDFHVIRRIGN